MLFFFSSRRRHTRLTCDWSSDVCSSDLGALGDEGREDAAHRVADQRRPAVADPRREPVGELLEAIDVVGPGRTAEIGRASCRERGKAAVDAQARATYTSTLSAKTVQRNA